MKTIEHKFKVPMSFQGKRLDRVLAVLMPEYSRTRLQNWIKSGNITVNNLRQSQRLKLLGGEEISLYVNIEPDDNENLKQEMPISVLYKDEDIIVINKPPGLVVHPGAGNPDHTLFNALLFHFPELENIPRAGIIQRLDKETSGIMVITRSIKANTLLVRDLQQRKIVREYQALVHGRLTAGRTIDAPIGRHPIKRTKMAVVDSGKLARTHIRIIERFKDLTHVRIKLETGRTHQIRVHMAYIHHPVLGDPVYAGRSRQPKNNNSDISTLARKFPRQALHAWRLELIHPSKEHVMDWTAPLPPDISILLSKIKNEPQK